MQAGSLSVKDNFIIKPNRVFFYKKLIFKNLQKKQAK